MTVPVGPNRRPVDDVLVVQLAAGATHGQAAEAAGCSERTVDRRLTDPEFRARVEQTRAATFARTAALLVDAAAEAVTELARLAREAEAEPVRVSAIRTLLGLGQQWHDSTSVEARLAALETRLGINPDPDRPDLRSA